LINGTNYFAAERYLRKRFLFLTLGGTIILFSVALAYAHGLISPRALRWVLLANVAFVTLLGFAILRKARARFKPSAGTLAEVPDDATRKKYRVRIRFLEFGVAFFALVFVYALWETRDAPWPPRLVGAAINLLIQVAMIRSIRRLQKELKQGTEGERP
jgi:hypothetical protein